MRADGRLGPAFLAGRLPTHQPDGELLDQQGDVGFLLGVYGYLIAAREPLSADQKARIAHAAAQNVVMARKRQRHASDGLVDHRDDDRQCPVGWLGRGEVVPAGQHTDAVPRNRGDQCGAPPVGDAAGGLDLEPPARPGDGLGRPALRGAHPDHDPRAGRQEKHREEDEHIWEEAVLPHKESFGRIIGIVVRLVGLPGLVPVDDLMRPFAPGTLIERGDLVGRV